MLWLRCWTFRLCLAAALALAFGYLPYRVYGPEGVQHLNRLERELVQLQQDNRRLEEENRALVEQARRLKFDGRAIEEVARNELGLVRPDDLVFLIERGAKRP